MYHLMLIHTIFSSVYVAEWPSFGERAAHSNDHMFSLYGGHPINRENCLLFCKTLPLIGVCYFHLKGKHLVSLQNKFYRN